MGKTLEEVIIEALMMEKAREIINPEVKILYQKKEGSLNGEIELIGNAAAIMVSLEYVVDAIFRNIPERARETVLRKFIQNITENAERRKKDAI